MSIELKRCKKDESGIFGLMRFNGKVFVTLEHPDLFIPAGTYSCIRVISPKFGEVFCITGVPKRDHILIHVGNYKSDSTGCILIGSDMGDGCITKSKVAFKAFMDALKNEMGFELLIIEEFNKD